MAAIVMIYVLALEFDYSNLSFVNNRSNYINIFVSILLIFSLLFSYLKERKKQNE
jgi:hypothetical protein